MKPLINILALFAIIFAMPFTHGQDTTPERLGMADGTTLLTIFLKHDQSKNLGEIAEILDEEGFWDAFPPQGTTVVSWYVMMGLGQVVTLEVPVEKLRAVNMAIEQKGWKAFSTEFYPTYNLYPAIQAKLGNQAKKNLE